MHLVAQVSLANLNSSVVAGKVALASDLLTNALETVLETGAYGRVGTFGTDL